MIDRRRPGAAAVVGALALVVGLAATASARSAVRAEVVAVGTARAPAIEVVVRPASGPDRPTYIVEVDGLERPATARPVDGRDLAVGIVVDNGASVPAEEIRALRAAALELVLAAPPGTAVAVAGTAGPEVSLATDAAAAVAAVVALDGPDRGPADPLAAVTSALRATTGRAVVPPAIVLLGSPGSAGPAVDAAGIASHLGSRPATIDALVLGAAPAWLAEVAAAAGGPTVAADGEELRLAARRLGAELAALQVVEFELPEGDQGISTVEVADPAPADGPVRLVARRAEASAGRDLGTAAVVSGSLLLVLTAAAAGAAMTGRVRAGAAPPHGGAATGRGSDPVARAVHPSGAGVASVPRPLRIRVFPAPGGRLPPVAAPEGEPTASEAALLGSLGDPDAAVRRRGAQLAGHGLSSAAVRERLVALLDDEPAVAEMAAYSLGEQGHAGGGAVDALSRLARNHPDSRCREAAVAALGAIGAGLPAILAASADDCGPVRRRAVVALAPFDGPEVDDALRRAAGDDDVDVRRTAQELSGR